MSVANGSIARIELKNMADFRLVRFPTWIGCVASLGLSASLCFAADQSSELLFAKRIKPLLAEKCMACHGVGDEIKGGLDLKSRASALQGGDSEVPAIDEIDPARSPLYLAVIRTDEQWQPMPPKESERLSEIQLGWVKEWIEAGSPWPNDERIKELLANNTDKPGGEKAITVSTSGGLSSQWTNRTYEVAGLWAYQPLNKPELEVDGSQAIDELIDRRLPAGLDAAPSAEPRILARRATFDLTGLPPTPREVAEFETDYAKDPRAAVRELVERLLASPHYGERMAQHWLDVVRYADSSGFANDYERGNAWRYRDYVIRAFNSDKPYDQFVREQIAGDELDPSNPELLIATGFLRMGPWELTGMEVAAIARQRFLDDVTNSVGETFLAHSLQCARCHDHKFDPIPTRDYYSLQAVFATAQLAERPAVFLPGENVAGFDERRYLELRRTELASIQSRLDDKSFTAAQDWFKEKQIDATKWNEVVSQVEKKSGSRKGLFNAARNEMLRQKISEDQFPPRMLAWTAEEMGLSRIASKGLERLVWEFERYEPYALSVYNGRTPQTKSINAPIRMPSQPPQTADAESTCILSGGDPFSKAEIVSPGVLSVLANVPHTPIPQSIDGRRAALAKWISSKDNPLAARVIANRIWMWHFGQPIAGNPNNFGSTGKRPTHPELLDWLAASLVERGWSIKELHRSIMLSRVYQRSCDHPHPALLAEKDPQSTSYATFQPRRLTAEELRDAALAVTGELNRTLGGIPNRPEINTEAATQPRQVMGTFAAAWVANPKPQERHRRSIYSLKLRGLADPSMEVFNSPAPDFSCERRENNTVTPQVFSLFNGRSSHTRALVLARRAIGESKDDRAALELCFRLAFGRLPNADEFDSCLSHWQRALTSHLSAGPVQAEIPLEIRRDAIEENSGERFSFTEKLYAHADFVLDIQPADCDQRTRTLAEICLVLLNTNEFAYVY